MELIKLNYMDQLISIWFYAPAENVAAVKAAMFDAGAGQIGNYDCCSWETEGIGQFRPLAGSTPHLGNKNQIEIAPEIRVEMVCPLAKAKAVIAAMKHTHPYEEVAHGIIKLEMIT